MVCFFFFRSSSRHQAKESTTVQQNTLVAISLQIACLLAHLSANSDCMMESETCPFCLSEFQSAEAFAFSCGVHKGCLPCCSEHFYTSVRAATGKWPTKLCNGIVKNKPIGSLCCPSCRRPWTSQCGPRITDLMKRYGISQYRLKDLIKQKEKENEVRNENQLVPPGPIAEFQCFLCCPRIDTDTGRLNPHDLYMDFSNDICSCPSCGQSVVTSGPEASNHALLQWPGGNWPICNRRTDGEIHGLRGIAINFRTCVRHWVCLRDQPNFSQRMIRTECGGVLIDDLNGPRAVVDVEIDVESHSADVEAPDDESNAVSSDGSRDADLEAAIAASLEEIHDQNSDAAPAPEGADSAAAPATESDSDSAAADHMSTGAADSMDGANKADGIDTSRGSLDNENAMGDVVDDLPLNALMADHDNEPLTSLVGINDVELAVEEPNLMSIAMELGDDRSVERLRWIIHDVYDEMDQLERIADSI